MTRVLATYNIKGGVGKTSAAVNLATLAAHDGARDAAVGPRPAGREHLPVPRQAQDQGRRREARARQDRRRRPRSRAPTPRAWTCCRPTSPTATWTSRSTDAKKPTRGSPRAQAARRLRLHVPGLPAEHQPRLRERVRGRRRAAGPDHPGDALARGRSTSSTRCSSATGPQVLGFFSMADRRKKLHRELMDELSAGARPAGDGDPDLGRRRADGRPTRRARGLRAAQPRRPRLRGPLGGDPTVASDRPR